MLYFHRRCVSYYILFFFFLSLHTYLTLLLARLLFLLSPSLLPVICNLFPRQFVLQHFFSRSIDPLTRSLVRAQPRFLSQRFHLRRFQSVLSILISRLPFTVSSCFLTGRLSCLALLTSPSAKIRWVPTPRIFHV